MEKSKQMTALEDFVNHEEEEFKTSFLETYVSANPVPSTPIKSSEQLIEEWKQNLEENLKAFKKDIIKGFGLFKEKTPETDLPHLGGIVGKILSITAAAAGVSEQSPEPITFEDYEFLEGIAKKELSAGNNLDASCMFRFIIQLEPLYSPAWVGWAVCEQEEGQLDVVEQIYEMALHLFPEDPMIGLYSAEFYLNNNKVSKAKEILKQTKMNLVNIKSTDSDLFNEVNRLLQGL